MLIGKKGRKIIWALFLKSDFILAVVPQSENYLGINPQNGLGINPQTGLGINPHVNLAVIPVPHENHQTIQYWLLILRMIKHLAVIPQTDKPFGR